MSADDTTEMVYVCDPRKQMETFPGTQRIKAQWVEFRVVTTSPFQTLEVWRRFSDFAALHDVLEVLIPGAIIPILPEKGAQLSISANLSTEAVKETQFIRAKV